ncbi:MAG: protein NO VEIN domain-containing protein, partial [Bacillus sp. (in: firmicutes)]
GKCYGFVENGRTNLARIEGAEIYKDHLDDVLVVWTAPNEKVGGRYIIGWYKHATVFSIPKKSSEKERKNYEYNVVADEKDCTLIPVDSRTMKIPRGIGFMGQSLVWYADGNTINCTPSDRKKVILFRNEVLSYIENYSLKQSKKNVYADKKAEVEKRSIAYVTNYYKSLGYSIHDVQKENKGWDLEASKEGVSLKIEVKGLSGDVLDVLLSKNEYEKMNASENKEIFRLCVVTNALKSPKLTTFLKYSKNWVAVDNPTMVLQFEEKSIRATIIKLDSNMNNIDE